MNRAELTEQAVKLNRELLEVYSQLGEAKTNVSALEISVNEYHGKISDTLEQLADSEPEPEAPAPEPQAEASAAEPAPEPEPEVAKEPIPEAPVVEFDPQNWATWPLSDLGLSAPVEHAFKTSGVVTIGALSEMITGGKELTAVGIGIADASAVQHKYQEWYNLFSQSQERVHLEPVT